jgi:hypothetical protein
MKFLLLKTLPVVDKERSAVTGDYLFRRELASREVLKFVCTDEE